MKNQDDNPQVKTRDPTKPWENVLFHSQPLYPVPLKTRPSWFLYSWNYLLLLFIELLVSMYFRNIRAQKYSVLIALLRVCTISKLLHCYFCSQLERDSASDSATTKLGRQVPYASTSFITTSSLERAYIFLFLYAHTFSEDLCLYDIFQ